MAKEIRQASSLSQFLPPDLESNVRGPPLPTPHSRNTSFEARPNKSELSRKAVPHTHSRTPSSQLAYQYMEAPDPARGRISQGFLRSDARSLSRDMPAPQDLLPPPPIGGSFSDRISSLTGSRASSSTRVRPDSGTFSRPGSRTASPSRPTTPKNAKFNMKKTWLTGKSHDRSRSASERKEPFSFIVGTPEKQEYELTSYTSRQPVKELWDDQGDLFIHLFGGEQPPSFRLKACAIESSRAFQRLLAVEDRPHGNDITGSERQMRNTSLGSNHSHADLENIEQEKHLYIPLQFANTTELQSGDLENLIALRNLFAFLVGQILVGTPKQPSLYTVFKNIAGLLSHYEFTNIDGSTHGDVSEMNFLGYMEDLRLDDVRNSAEQTLEAIVLGEMMKSWPLYNEGYIHAVGRWEEIYEMDSENMKFINPITRKRMEKSYMNLELRLEAVEARMNDFDYPSLFQGIALSSGFQKAVDGRTWRNSWVSMRRFTMNHYKTRYGAWPPKASSTKNDFEESGLNRIVLQELYKDFSDLYDMLVDKSNLTSRTADMAAHDERLSDKLQLHWLRQLMSEFDRSSPPVKPPIPYDLCLLPDSIHLRRDYDSLPDKKKSKERARKLKPDEINLLLIQSYDRDSMRATPFLESFMAYERQIYQGKSVDEIIDLRIGQWIFLYVVLQSLPLLVVDAPGVHYTEGVEYFLCQVPKGTAPWLREDTNDRRLYRVGEGSSLASLPTDAIHNSVEGIYERSHCWEMAKIWSHGLAKMPAQGSVYTNRSGSHSRMASQNYQDSGSSLTGLAIPPLLVDPWKTGSAHSSPRNSVALGLEELELPPALRTDVGTPGRKFSTPDATKTFDDILGPPTGGKKKGWTSFSG